jgi:hypothetical protein
VLRPRCQGRSSRRVIAGPKLSTHEVTVSVNACVTICLAWPRPNSTVNVMG